MLKCYRMHCYKRDDNGNMKYITTVDGITKSDDIVASAFRQNPDVLPFSDRIELTYYEL